MALDAATTFFICMVTVFVSEQDSRLLLNGWALPSGTFSVKFLSLERSRQRLD